MLEENNNSQENSLNRILSSTKNLMEQIEESAIDLAIDDFATPRSFLKPAHKKKLAIFLAGAAVGSLCSLALTLYTSTTADDRMEQLIQERAAEESTLTPVADINLPVLEETETTAEAEVLPPTPDHIDKFTIKPQESLAAVLKRGGISNQNSHKITTALSDILNLKRLQVGDTVEIGYMNGEEGDTKELFMVTVEDRRGNRYTAARADEDYFEAGMTEPEVDLKTEYAEGTIEGAFINNAKGAGIPTNVTQQIIWAFDGPVDFSRDLRKGDTFVAIFDKEYNKDGQPTGNGNLIYAALKLRSTTHERYLYTDSKEQQDYYDETGRIARKLFTMHPLKNPRQTSRFGMRKHPILGYSTMHWGADFGAPVGTAIRAPGEGTITQSGRKGAYGRHIQIRHNSEFSTAYAHMDKIHEKMYVGKKVKAGEIIGYVGNSGRSTGPHLHWELIRNGKKINPITQRITAEKRLKGQELERFYAARDKIRDDISGEEILLAKAEALPEARKMAYQGPQKTKKKVARKPVAKKTYSKTAARRTKSNKS